jgi:hypothetical protein
MVKNNTVATLSDSHDPHSRLIKEFVQTEVPNNSTNATRGSETVATTAIPTEASNHTETNQKDNYSIYSSSGKAGANGKPSANLHQACPVRYLSKLWMFKWTHLEEPGVLNNYDILCQHALLQEQLVLSDKLFAARYRFRFFFFF